MSEPSREPDALLTIPEVSALLRVSPDKVRALIADNACPLRAVKLGRYVRVPRSSYDALMGWLAA